MKKEMKNKGQKKLSLDKIKIAKLDNIESIAGGSITDLQIISLDIDICATASIDRCTNSTKTTPVGGEGS